MQAAVLRDLMQPMGIETLSISKPAAREVLVRLAAAGACHSELHILTGNLPHPLPAVLGHEAAGVVEQVGSDVATVKPGDHVIVCLTFHCGHCEPCETGNSHRGMPAEAPRSADSPPRLSIGPNPVTQFINMGAFAEQILVHESGCALILRDMPFDLACLISCGVATGFGATDTIDTSQGGMVEQVMALTNGRGVDHAIEAIGLKTTIEDAFNSLCKGGTATVVGAARPDTGLEIPALALLRDKKLQGAMMGGVRNTVDIPRYVAMYLADRLKLDELISRRRPLSEINAAFADMPGGEVARSVILSDH